MKDITEQHELIGRLVLRIITDFVRQLDSRRVTSEATVADTERLFDEPFPETGIEIEEILHRFETEVAPHAMLVPSSRYFGQFNPTPLPIGVWADALTSVLNQNAGAWRNGPTSAMIEARVIRWLCQMVGYRSESYGTLASGGSEANLIALKCARDSVSREVITHGVRSVPQELYIYASEQCHYSIEKSADLLGLGRESVRKIPTDELFHIRIDELRHTIQRDLAEGRKPFCIVGVAGATSTGVVDPLRELAGVAREFGCWYHIDAAYGGPLLFSEIHASKLDGIDLGDSITFDPHKWMFVPFSCGAVLVRAGGRVLRDAFDITPEYLSEDRGGDDVQFDFFRYGQMGTRRFNSLKLWMALKFLGRRGYAEIIERQIGLTEYFAKRIDSLTEFERASPVETAVCCFRFMPDKIRNADGPVQDRMQQQLQQRIERGGEAWLTTTVLRGRRVLRININSFLTEKRHVDDLLALLQRESQQPELVL
ncbi:MAG TPA: pyridoxal-dependent decarboxylase [Pyrinomonadaceae bacterium]|nr:pyridoxal-dependent decarboxylase [Pyrinomonadaceae bacterium]